MDDKSVDAHQTFRAEFIRGHPAYRRRGVGVLSLPQTSLRSVGFVRVRDPSKLNFRTRNFVTCDMIV